MIPWCLCSKVRVEREDGVKVETVAEWESDTGVGETDGGDDKGWEIVGTVQSELKGTGTV